MPKLNLINIKKLKSPKVNYIEYVTPISNLLSLGMAEERGRQKGKAEGMFETYLNISNEQRANTRGIVDKRVGSSIVQEIKTVPNTPINTPSPSRPPSPLTPQKVQQQFKVKTTPIEAVTTFSVNNNNRKEGPFIFDDTNKGLDRMYNFFSNKGYTLGSKKEFIKELEDTMISSATKKVVPKTGKQWSLVFKRPDKGQIDLRNVSKPLFP